MTAVQSPEGGGEDSPARSRRRSPAWAAIQWQSRLQPADTGVVPWLDLKVAPLRTNRRPFDCASARRNNCGEEAAARTLRPGWQFVRQQRRAGPLLLGR